MFKRGQNSLEVAQVIVKSHPQIESILLISHKVSVNWRQKYRDSKSKLEHIAESLQHPKPIKKEVFSRKQFLKIKLDSLKKLSDDEVWSLTSLVTCSDGTKKHIPMMNLHPIDISEKEIRIAIQNMYPTTQGVILSSGRFFHYYGNDLLDKNEWLTFMTNFLMPCVLVSPRYIGHRLFSGYATLRLTTDKTYKKKVPKVTELI